MNEGSDKHPHVGQASAAHLPSFERDVLPLTDDLRRFARRLTKDAETLYLIAVEGMSSREVADVLSIPPSTLSRMHRIRNRLRQPLGAAARRRRLLAQKRETDAA